MKPSLVNLLANRLEDVFKTTIIKPNKIDLIFFLNSLLSVFTIILLVFLHSLLVTTMSDGEKKAEKPTTLMDALHQANQNSARNIEYVQEFTLKRMFKLGE